jgi:hypothetical protein
MGQVAPFGAGQTIGEEGRCRHHESGRRSRSVNRHEDPVTWFDIDTPPIICGKQRGNSLSFPMAGRAGPRRVRIGSAGRFVGLVGTSGHICPCESDHARHPGPTFPPVHRLSFRHIRSVA